MSAQSTGARPLSLLVHQLVEAGVVDCEPLLLEQLLGQVVGEAVGVVKLEGILGGDPGSALALRTRDHLSQEPGALLERVPEALLLCGKPFVNRAPLAL